MDDWSLSCIRTSVLVHVPISYPCVLETREIPPMGHASPTLIQSSIELYPMDGYKGEVGVQLYVLVDSRITVYYWSTDICGGSGAKGESIYGESFEGTNYRCLYCLSNKM